MIVGNKIDLPNRTVDREMGKKFAKQQRGKFDDFKAYFMNINCIFCVILALFVETSAAQNLHVDKCFEELVKKILEDNIFDDNNAVTRSDIRLNGLTSENSGTSSSSCGFCR